MRPTILLASLLELATLAVAGPIPGLWHHDQWKMRTAFNIDVQGFPDGECANPVHGLEHVRVSKYSHCHTFHDRFKSLSYEWVPYNVSGQPLATDPTRDLEGREKRCKIEFYKKHKCHGKPMFVLWGANQWDKIGHCLYADGTDGNATEHKKAKSVNLVCDDWYDFKSPYP